MKKKCRIRRAKNQRIRPDPDPHPVFNIVKKIQIFLSCPKEEKKESPKKKNIRKREGSSDKETENKVHHGPYIVSERKR